MFGLTVDGSDLVAQTLAKLNSLLDLTLTTGDINNIYKIGRGTNSPIVIEFVSFLKKAEVFKDTEKLKSLKNTGVAVGNDLCREDREHQKILRKHLKRAKEAGQEAKIIGDKLKINSRVFTITELESGSESETDDNDGSEEDDGRLTGSKEGGVAGKYDTEVNSNNLVKNKGQQTKRKVQTPSPTIRIAGSRRRKKPKQH